MADEQLDGPLSDSLCVLKDKVHALEVTEVIRHHSGDEALQLLHVQRAWDIRLIGAGNRPATHVCMFHQLSLNSTDKGTYKRQQLVTGSQ